MGKTIRIVVECKVEVKVPLSGASADELALSIGRVRDQMGRKLMELSVETIQEAIVERPRLPRRAARHGAWRKPDKRRCTCTSFTKLGFRRGGRSIRTHLGEVNFRVRNVRCERCGERYTPILRFLDLRERKRRLSSLEKIVAEVVSLETYGKSENLVEKATGERIPDATMHDWMADIDWDALDLGRYKRAKTVMADGTGVKMRGGSRGELRVVIGLDGRNKPFPLGVYSGTPWERIGPEIKARLKDRDQATLFVHDGEIAIDEHLSGIAEKTGRCRWHMPRGVKYALWGDGAGKDEQQDYARKLRGILGVEIPADDWQALGADDLAPLRKELDDSRKAYEKLVEEFGARGYVKAREYLANAMGKVFTQVETWLDTGVVMPGTISQLERIMRELGRRLKKLGYGWTDEGLVRIAKILLKRIHEPDAWEEHWVKLGDIRGRCRVIIREARITELSIIG